MELAIYRPTGSGDMAVDAKVICKLKLWTAAILNLCKLTTFPVSKSWRLFRDFLYVHQMDLINKLKPKNLLLQFVLGPVK